MLRLPTIARSWLAWATRSEEAQRSNRLYRGVS
jgi:hypothetical protein